MYFVRSCFRLLLQQPTSLSSRHEVSKQIWATRCPPKIKIALWKFVHIFVAARSCLYNRRVANKSSCLRCKVDHETVNHVLRFCAKARDVWVMMGYPFVVSAQMDFHEWLSWILKMHLEGDSRSVIRKINNHEQDFSDISALTWSAKEIVKEFQVCAIYIIGISRNKTVHAMAQEGLSRGEDDYCVEDAPALVEAASAEDCNLHEPS
ncbi:hypothetical protein Gogos_003405 [Gossypium gossypioides]|uniref:Reverse transcriptase zinc-binding domain-containing protein n=1 Tax=Gossypium gossypioides TaxID=34282 RepID=A0A7J9CMR6_GOSGO|nr:hypothetical protein [Gossypium gossypioides]